MTVEGAECGLSTQFLKFPKLLINYRINIYLLSLSTALAAKIFTMKSLDLLQK
ncbi:unknown protein [Microcystis aeruginosa NIES-843]|uniref:Uncharacterized protein n=1 Tax=Microcystis aeruginosa (strain NIES-843 / IAM M-2473) TaxID=449447 RepID=B0JWE9_MICAN|nr:unknown protein [Microcystis aeruginosa NIES-843]